MMNINIFNQCHFISSISFLHHIPKELLNSAKYDVKDTETLYEADYGASEIGKRAKRNAGWHLKG